MSAIQTSKTSQKWQFSSFYKKSQAYIISFLSGILFGGTIAFTVLYPVKVSDIDKAKQICVLQESGTAVVLNISVTGKIHKIKCSNGITFDIN